MLRNRKTLIAAAVVAVLLLWVPVVTRLGFPSKMDEATFHVPNVLRFVDHFPTLEEMRGTDLSMLPLFHGVMGFLVRLTGGSLPSLRAWMMVIGFGAFFTFLCIAGRIPGVDPRRAAPALAAFPYFGVCYFVVMTDYPALFALLGAVLAQIAYLRSGRMAAAVVAGLAGAAACLIRQNLIFASGVFILLLVLRQKGWLGIDAERARHPEPPGADGTVARGRPLLRLAVLPSLALPFLAVIFQVWLWKGVIPPSFMNRANYYEPNPGTMLLSLFSIGANVGYYLLPATMAFLLVHGRRISRRIWLAVAVATAAGLCWCVHLRGRDLVNTYGTFLHGLSLPSYRFGIVFGAALLALSLVSFFTVVVAGVRWVARVRSSEACLMLGLFAGALLVASFGLSHIYERHILPIFVFAILLFLGSVPLEDRRLRWGWSVAVVFAAAHSVIYAISVYELKL